MVFSFLRKGKEEIEKTKEELRRKEKLISEMYAELERLKKENENLKEQIENLEEEIETQSVMGKISIPLLKSPSIQAAFNYLLEILHRSERNYYQKIVGEEAKKIIFAHYDGDGICCTALFERFNKNEDSKFFYISQGNRNLITKVKPTEELFIFDLALDENLANYVKKLTQNGIKVKWIDHHAESLSNTSPGLFNQLRNEGILVYEDAKSAARLYYDYSHFNDEIGERICLIADRSHGDKSERTAKVKKDAILLGRISHLDKSILDVARKELAKYGEIRNEKLKEIARVCDLLIAHGKEIVEENLLYDGRNVRVYLQHLPLVKLKRVMLLLSSKHGKDIFLIEDYEATTVYGFTKMAEKIFPKLAEEFSGESYWKGPFGKWVVNKNAEEILETLKKLYEK